ncbi:unnamed protein product [Phaedon cochleariae]|uniref:Rapamycin-insensitive companion of mTOR n=1 Tax=Phaedon cochleariae TaxID=80249 RepID=A0A9N9SC65_PHACE|nr:unnamed protein product [Phaedon cochleariae]
MAVRSWMIRHQMQIIRSGRYNTVKQNRQEDVLASLQNLSAQECFKKLLSTICQEDVDESVLFNHLNALLKLTLRHENSLDKIGYHIEDLLCCLRICLTHVSAQIRSTGLRCIRLVLKSENDIVHMNNLLIPYLLTRSLDLISRNDGERIEAMKLIRKALIISPASFDMSLARCLVSLAYEGTEAKDRMLRICLATLSELGVLNPKLFIISGGVTALSRNLLECQTPKIAESLCGVLLLLLDKPFTRFAAAVDLHCAAAPFCDFHYKHGTKDKNKRDERELRLNCGRLAMLTILRSWSGILHFCSPNDKGGFRSIVEVLYLPQLEVRKSVLDLLYELLGLPQPEWTDELSVALCAVDPCEPQSSWRLNEGFVVAEGRSVLPHLAKTTPSTTDMHLALLLYCFLENGLLAALTEVIATSDTFICVRASVLLGELLRLIQVLLPPGCCNLSPSLPLLLEYATRSKPQAIAAITALEQLHMLMKRRPASYSLHLDYIIRNSYYKRMENKNVRSNRIKQGSGFQKKLHQLVLRDGDDAVKETGVLLSNDAYTWDWNLINIILKGENNAKIDLFDSSHRTFVKKLLEFYMPSKNKYSHMDLGTSRSSVVYTTAGIELINFLTELKEPDFNGLKPLNMILDLFKDILSNIDAITTSRNVHDCLFSPQHMVNTQCQSYFLFIGQFSRSDVGVKVLENISMFKKLKELATTTNHDCYVKLIISSLEYIFPGQCREILEAVLTCSSESSRLLKELATTANHDCYVKLIISSLEYIFFGPCREILEAVLTCSSESSRLLKELATTTNHDCYVKLIISSLEYIFPGPCREILEAVLTCSSESSRLYATQFLHILLRSGNPLFSTWGVKLLVDRLFDKSRAIYLSALATLHEACEVTDCLQALIDIDPDLKRLGERGSLLSIRFLSMESGFEKATKDKVLEELKKWDEHFVYRYVKLVEGDISDALTLHQRNEDGRYDKRASSLRNANKRDVFLPPHLYGQLSQHARGFEVLIDQERVEKIVDVIKKARCNTDDHILELKASVWSVGHVGSSRRGYDYLAAFGIPDRIIALATKATVYSIRATAFYALGLLGATSAGADDLGRRGWLCTRHDRHDNWPVIREELEGGEGTEGLEGSVDSEEEVDDLFEREFENAGEVEGEMRDFMGSPCSPGALLANCQEKECHVWPEFTTLTSKSHHRTQSIDLRQLRECVTRCARVIFSSLVERNTRRSLLTLVSKTTAKSRLRDFIGSTCSPERRRMRQSTLPTNKRPPIVFHTRSLSESKTFDVKNGFDEDHSSSLVPFAYGRHRNSSMTESTTSGVSSCDSLPNKHATGGSYLKTLSPIPSSSSLSTLQIPTHFKRISRPISSNSTTNSDISSSSMTGSVSNELSVQNLVGYNTLKLLRRMEGLNFDSPNYEQDYLFNTTPHLTSTASTISDDFKIIDNGFVSVFSVPKFEVKMSPRQEDRRYMGVCLPKVLTDIFPSQEEISRDPHIFPDSSCSAEYNADDKQKSWRHSRKHCFSCSRTENAGKMDDLITENLITTNCLDGDSNWPARSSDLTPLDFHLWGYLKQQVYESPIVNMEEMNEKITNLWAQIDRNLDEYFDLTETVCSFMTQISTNINSYVDPQQNQGRGEHDTKLKTMQSMNESKLEVLENVERLPNPISNKYVKSHLIRFKQREPDTFKDLCVFSEVCKMMSENIYRLPTRRVLHELFFDVSFVGLYEEAKKSLERDVREEETSGEVEVEVGLSNLRENSFSSDISSPTESVKTLDSLRLTFSENKFPIREKNK